MCPAELAADSRRGRMQGQRDEKTSGRSGGGSPLAGERQTRGEGKKKERERATTNRREKERAISRGNEGNEDGWWKKRGKKEGENVCVCARACMYVCVRERERWDSQWHTDAARRNDIEWRSPRNAPCREQDHTGCTGRRTERERDETRRKRTKWQKRRKWKRRHSNYRDEVSTRTLLARTILFDRRDWETRPGLAGEIGATIGAGTGTERYWAGRRERRIGTGEAIRGRDGAVQRYRVEIPAKCIVVGANSTRRRETEL